jgi:membrane protein YdbS with pleckstrin-like domain
MFPAIKQSCPVAKQKTRGRLVAMGKQAGLREELPMSDLDQRIEAMYRSDVRGAWAFIIALWITILFVLFMSWPHIPDGGVRIVALLAAAAVLIFNTASIAAMVKNYAADKHFIYGLDIKMLDEARKNQG